MISKNQHLNDEQIPHNYLLFILSSLPKFNFLCLIFSEVKMSNYGLSFVLYDPFKTLLLIYLFEMYSSLFSDDKQKVMKFIIS